ncbi:three-Cys-motif partner protein TcmP [Pyxidicoccus sp. MSG2]|uniref:three-Cys-motif partner protein TcmP n=1 Tax=Pyxidicoccus sp. MSG2 TaxID=2996790 RepID=UPI00226FA8F9|nr:three-Cys-motif partner protein TcmP [Pyxidicoccus sp. MSG2]MCY1023986.1 three-Cys-motif partner protein TcmP [Pyxidicoccus sp. MSG2]
MRDDERGDADAQELYDGRDQSWVKHFILRKYLERFARIVGSKWSPITYVDGFSGPWNTQSSAFKDSSFAIALDELRRARDTLKAREIELGIRCFFIEKNRAAYQHLHDFAKTTSDADVCTKNCEFEEAIPEILRFIRAGGRSGFPFIFIDPTGWTGFAMDEIRPLLELEPGEVLINFMTKYIRRFVNSPQEVHRESFERLFGSGQIREEIIGLAKQDREDRLVRAYVQNVKRTGRFKHVCTAVVLNPLSATTHFHLIYATRGLKGVEVFKDAEQSAMDEMEARRANAQRHNRVERSGQNELVLFGRRDDPKSDYYEQLRDRYLTKAREGLRRMLEQKVRVLYDDAWAFALAAPLTWEQDVKRWLADWKKEGLLTIEGLGDRERVPKLRQGVNLVWRAGQR